jgi:hypothetical protein
VGPRDGVGDLSFPELRRNTVAKAPVLKALKLTAGDNDRFRATIKGVDLTGATVTLHVQRPGDTAGAPLIVAATPVDLASGVVDFIFASSSDLESGNGQTAEIQWIIAGVVLTSAKFKLDVARGIA